MRRRLLSALASLLVLPGLTCATAQPAAAGPDVSTPAAQRALARVQQLLGHAPGERSEREHPTGRDATLALRDLRRERDGLSRADRATADRLLARPSAGRSRCFPRVCVHWSTRGDDRATRAFARQVADTAQSVLGTYAAAGYKRPERDGQRGGDGRLDIYLLNLGSQGVYGYCDTDRPPPPEGPYDAPAYCAFDNDFAEFPDHTQLENLQVTAAHELFHAVQFAYDYWEDAWFMEATAVWVEDEVYDDVNDNLQYLSESPLRQPGASFDHFIGLRPYGDWIFFRYLTERFRASDGGLPTLVRAMWQRADGSAGARDMYSIRAVSSALAARGTTLRKQFAAFADGNRRPGTSYDEGAANGYPTAPLAGRVKLSGAQRSSGWRTERVNHLASATLRFLRASGMAARSLRVRLDLPATRRGSGVVATIYRGSAAPETVPIGLSRRGDATRSLSFGRRVRAVEVTLANAGTHYRCWRGTGYSCQGRPLDNDLPLKVKATALR